MELARGGLMSNAHMRVGPEYFRIIGHFERGKANDPRCRLTSSGAALDAYLCPANVPTIGAGSIRRLDGSPVEMGDTITEEDVYRLAERDAEHAADAVRKINRPLKQHQFDACTAFTHNLGEGNFRKIAPLIEEGRWEDAAEKMSEYVRAWGRYEGRWHYQALLGLRIRRFAEGLLLNGYEWSDLCDPDDIGMPKQRPPEWQPNGTAKDGTKGRYFDVLLPGATEFATLEAAARPLASLAPPELVLSIPASPPQADEVAQRQQIDPARSPAAAGAAPVIEKPLPVGPSAATAPPVKIPAPQRAPEGTVVLPSQKVDTKPPEQLPPPLPPPKDPLPANLVDPKDMVLSRRFWGLMVTAIGTTHLIPADWSKWLANETTRELVSWIAVVGAGTLLYWWGKRKATRPLK